MRGAGRGCELSEVREFCFSSGSYCVIKLGKVAEQDDVAGNCYPGVPFTGFGAERDTLAPTLVVRADALVHHVLATGGGSQISPTVIRPITVDVIHIVRRQSTRHK